MLYNFQEAGKSRHHLPVASLKSWQNQKEHVYNTIAISSPTTIFTITQFLSPPHLHSSSSSPSPVPSSPHLPASRRTTPKLRDPMARASAPQPLLCKLAWTLRHRLWPGLLLRRKGISSVRCVERELRPRRGRYEISGEGREGWGGEQ